MTDASFFFQTCVNACRVMSQNLEDLKSVSDRIGADSALSSETAAAAAKVGRTDLTAADFDNLKVCIDLMQDLLNAINGGNVPVSVNTGGTVKLGFYKII
jgi:hypothetical protein